MPKAAGQKLMYRYRTKALVGPWRRSSSAAVDDAIRAGQARTKESGEYYWLATGVIEHGFGDQGIDRKLAMKQTVASQLNDESSA